MQCRLGHVQYRCNTAAGNLGRGNSIDAPDAQAFKGAGWDFKGDQETRKRWDETESQRTITWPAYNLSLPLVFRFQWVCSGALSRYLISQLVRASINRYLPTYLLPIQPALAGSALQSPDLQGQRCPERLTVSG
jgi:hypothetical protein